MQLCVLRYASVLFKKNNGVYRSLGNLDRDLGFLIWEEGLASVCLEASSPVLLRTFGNEKENAHQNIFLPMPTTVG